MADPGEFTDDTLARYRRELERSLRQITAQIRAALKDAHLDADGGLVVDAHNLALARGLGDEIARLADGALAAVVDDFREAVRDLVAVVGTALDDAGVGAEFTAATASLARAQAGTGLDRLIADATGTLVRQSDDLRAQLREVAIQMVRTNADPADAVEELAGKVGATAGQTLSLVDTTMSGADRAVTLDVAQAAGVEWFAFVGPVDSLTRPWCRRHVGFRYTLEQMDSLPDNDTGPQPPSTYGGGYNCRHRWEPLVDEEAQREYPEWRG